MLNYSVAELRYDILVHVEPAGECQTDEKFGVNKGMV